MKTGRWAAVVALCLLLLSGCGGKPLPAGMEEEALLDAGRQVALLVIRGEYGQVQSMLREDQRALVSEEDIQTLALGQLGDAGVYEQIESSMTTSQSSQGETYGVAVFYCAFSQEDVLIRVAFDPEMELIGLAIQQQ